MNIKARELNGKVLNFEVVESIDTRGTFEPIQLDYSQPNDDYFNYNFYRVNYADDIDVCTQLVCIDCTADNDRCYMLDIINNSAEFANICSYMDDEIREQLHSECCLCSMDNVEFLKRYCELDTEFTQLLSEEFYIEMEVLN